MESDDILEDEKNLAGWSWDGWNLWIDPNRRVFDDIQDFGKATLTCLALWDEDCKGCKEFRHLPFDDLLFCIMLFSFLLKQIFVTFFMKIYLSLSKNKKQRISATISLSKSSKAHGSQNIIWACNN